MHAPPPLPQIHWFSIINSCVTVLLLTGFLATILMRVLKADFVKYSRDDGEGWPRGCLALPTGLPACRGCCGWCCSSARLLALLCCWPSC
jgi:hypothetical protein